MSEVTNETVAPELQKRKLVRKHGSPSKIKYQIWLAGHAMCIVFGLVTLVWQALWLPNRYYINSICYRMALLGASLAMISTMSHKYGLRYLPPFTTLLAQHNFQNLVLAVVWCFTFKSVLKIIPFFLISLLQLAEHKKIAPVQKQSDFLSSIIGVDNLVLAVYLLLRTLLFRQTSGFQLITMFVFLWLRILFDKQTADMFAYLMERADGKMSTVKNKKVTKAWAKAKGFVEDRRNKDTF